MAATRTIALGAADTFQELRLRSGSHDTHSLAGARRRIPAPATALRRSRASGDAQLIRNIWIEDMQLLMGQPGKHGRMVTMFVNGNYYGIYHIQEHADDDYMASYYPGQCSDDYHFTGAAVTGSVHGAGIMEQPFGRQMKASPRQLHPGETMGGCDQSRRLHDPELLRRQ